MKSKSPENITDESLVYTSNEPDIQTLRHAYDNCLLNLDEYFEICNRSYDDRRNIWDGKTTDLRKNGSNAFPWDGASDMEVNVIGERIDAFVSILDQALTRSHIKAFPTSTTSIPRAALVSSFLKWMKSSYIPDFKNQMELGANYLLEKGIMVTYVGWKREKRTFLQDVSLEELAQASPDMAEMIINATDDEMLIDMIIQAFPHMNAKRVKKFLIEIRKVGRASIPVPRMSINCPFVQSCAPDGEVLFPPYVIDPQKSPYIFWRTFVTAQELEKKVTSEGWDADWVQGAIEDLRGKDSYYLDGQKAKRFTNLPVANDDDLVMLVYAYQRLIDEDGAEGIYCTVFNPNVDGYAKTELLNGYDDYPFVTTRLSYNQNRMYEVQTFPDILRGAQLQIKTERDSRIDRASLATLPPLMHPAGRPPSDWGPGRRVSYRRLGEIAFGPIPPPDNGSMEIELSMNAQADRAVGLDMNSPISGVRQQFFVNKYLDHVKDVLGLAWKLFQRMGPDEIFFQVTGNPNPQTMTKGSPDENYSFTVSFDSLSADPDNAESRMKQIGSLVQFDRNGRIDMDKFLEFAAMSIDPVFGDYVLQPAEEATAKVQKQVTDDLAKIYAGIEMPAQPNGAQIAMQMLQAYAQQPDVAQRAQTDEAFGARLQKYAEQYQFQMQQMENAQIGRIGTAPAEMGGIQTQGMNQQQ
tara:strand:- start:2287 stop:4362 length:2076 start_codon:yes stop_codon:yes gene_type:complete